MASGDRLADGSSEARDAVREAARTHAYDRYLAALLAPRDVRDDLVTLAAFAGEVRRVPLSVSDATLGEIRLQWWRDAIGAFASGGQTGNPVADALAGVAQRRGLASGLLLAVVEGHARELYEDGAADQHELLHYAAETEGALARLAAAVCGAAAVPEDAFEAAGQALALTGLALDLPRHLARGRLPVPLSWREECGDPRGLEAAAAGVAAQAITARLITEARQGLGAFRGLQTPVPAASFAAFLPMMLVEPYLRALEHPRHDPARELADISPIVRVVRLWVGHWRGRL